METVEHCDFCDDVAVMDCPSCGATVCNYHVTHVCDEYKQMVDECITARERDDTDARLTRYITNRNKRTGKTWHVVKRYATFGDGQYCPVDAEYAWYQRAVIENEHGERVRIYYRGSCWCVA